MTPQQYHVAAMRTAAGPEVFHVPEDEQKLMFTENEFIIDMVEFLRAAARLDDWKSRLFYGKVKYDRSELVGFEDHGFPEFPKFDDYLEGEMYLSEISDPRLIHAVLGLATEGAEVVEDMLKLMRPNTAGVDRGAVYRNIIREGGDISWYLELMAEASEIDVQAMRIENIERLRKRFPDKFSEADALARADEGIHKSDCATHNAPAYENGPCDCGAGA